MPAFVPVSLYSWRGFGSPILSMLVFFLLDLDQPYREKPRSVIRTSRRFLGNVLFYRSNLDRDGPTIDHFDNILVQLSLLCPCIEAYAGDVELE